ncbi:hypothetical protein BDZ45DRAFT_368825 [Acephala macrosclerotiorum]|nr:hypothetical protein BDZ45DRAFT_368825 [Acephala macrosclerotiorum]
MMMLEDIAGDVWRVGTQPANDFCGADMMVMIPTCIFAGKALAAVPPLSVLYSLLTCMRRTDTRVTAFFAADPASHVGLGCSPLALSPLSSPVSISIFRRNALRVKGAVLHVRLCSDALEFWSLPLNGC